MIIELSKLFILVALTIWLFVHKRHAALFTVCLIYAFLGGLAPNIGIDIWPWHIIGILYLTVCLFRLRIPLDRSPAIKALWGWYVLLILLMVLYGWLFPWPDLTGERLFNQTAQGRSLIFSGGLVLFLFCFLYFYYGKFNRAEIRIIPTAVAYSSAVCGIAVFIDVIGIDLFNLLNPGIREGIGYDVIGRARGLNGEPRVSSQILAFGIVTMLFYPVPRFHIPILFISLSAFMFTASLSGSILIFTGTLYWLVAKRKINTSATMGMLVVVLISAVLGFTTDFGKNALTGLESYLVKKQEAVEMQGLLEVFDASAVEFFKENPRHLLVGTGPGLISLPASAYIPYSARSIYGDRIDSIPHMGFIQVISNTGLLGAGIFLAFLYFSINYIRRAEGAALLPRWSAKYIGILIFFYALQAHLIWLLIIAPFLSVGRRRNR